MTSWNNDVSELRIRQTFWLPALILIYNSLLWFLRREDAHIYFVWWFTSHSLSFIKRHWSTNFSLMIHISFLIRRCSTRFSLMIHSLPLWFYQEMLFKPFRLMIQTPTMSQYIRNTGHNIIDIFSQYKHFPPAAYSNKMTKISKDHYQFPWTNDMLLLTCIFRLRIYPFVPYSEIADIFMQSLSGRLSGLPSTWVKTHNNSEKWMKSYKYFPNFPGKLNLIPPLNVLALSWNNERLLILPVRVGKCLEENFKGAEFRGDQIWYTAKDVDAELVGEMVGPAGLDKKGYRLAAAEEMELQIRWRRNGDWRAGSIPDGEDIVQPGVGTIGNRQRWVFEGVVGHCNCNSMDLKPTSRTSIWESL